jgi:GrpB-like predicted nucleotidyltransferase (UPF0157 family)
METLEQKVQRVLREEIALEPYNPRWPEMFREEEAHLRACLPPHLIRRIEHFGSTSVPGLVAKPIIDMLIEVSDFQAARTQIAPILEAQGYDYFWRATFSDDVPPFYAWFIKRDAQTGARTHHLHMITTAPEFAGHWDNLLFRDYLIAHPEVAAEYARHKLQVAETHRHDRIAYTAAKGEFIAGVMDKAREWRINRRSV